MRHTWEEPIISGSKGSLAIFFTGCNLSCVYCQNIDISRSKFGKIYSEKDLYEKILQFGPSCHNINFVTASHQLDNLIPIMERLKKESFKVPLLWNTSSYEDVESFKKLDGLIDIYLADFKYLDSNLAYKYSLAKDYPLIAQGAFKEMFRQRGPFKLNQDKNLLESGIIARHLVLPGNIEDSMDIVDLLFSNYKNDIIYSLMMQYTPNNNLLNFEELNKKVSYEEYNRLLNFSLALGIENAYIQEIESSSKNFIPDFSIEEEL